MAYLNPKLVLKTPPASEPVTVAEAKLHCRVDISDDDAWFTNAIVAARQACEVEAKRAFITQTWTAYFDRFPGAAAASSCPVQERPVSRDKRAIRMPLPPLASVTSIVYLDTNGASQTLNASKYLVDDKDDPGVIVPAYGESWPDTRDQLNAVAIEFVAGAASVDARVKQGVLMLVAHWYENRETVAVGAMTREIEMAVCYLMGQLWNGTLR